MGLLDSARDLLNQHDDKVDQGLDRTGEAAKGRFAGHESHIDSAVDRAQAMTGGGDSTRAPGDEPQRAAPPEAVPDRPAEGVEPAPEVPGGPQVDVPAGPGHVPPQQ